MQEEYYNLTDDPNYYKRKKREWYLKNKEKSIKQAREWALAHPERTKEARKAWEKKNPERKRIYARRKMLRSKYNISPAEYDVMFDAQQGTCAICQNPCSSGRRLAVDHNHRTGKVRELLCARCNVRLGMIESVQSMRFTIRPFLRYLKKHGDYR